MPTERSSLLADLDVEQGPANAPQEPAWKRRQASFSGATTGYVPTRKHKQDVFYDGDNNFGVIFQWYGSVWPQVLPWCFFSVAFTYLIIYLRNADIVDLTIKNNTGHGFMSILVSFLVVTRTTITYNRFMEARLHLATLFRAAREIVQYTCLLSLTNTGQEAQKWRRDVAYRTIVTLRMAVAAVEFRSQGISAWEALPEEEHEVTELFVGPMDDSSMNASARHYSPRSNHSEILGRMAHCPRTVSDENLRAPIVWAYNLREKIMATRQKDILVDRPMHPNEELKILAIVNEFLDAFHGLKKLITTPFPFPLVQMSRTFLFFWVFSLPLVLINDNDQTYEVLVLMFFCTYGFFGLEITSNELSDPFGSDPNDFPIQRWSESVFEDIYIFIYKTDGYENAMKLRSRITARIARGSALDNYREDQSLLGFFNASFASFSIAEL